MREKIKEMLSSSFNIQELPGRGIFEISEVRKLEAEFTELETTIITLGDMNKKQRVKIEELNTELTGLHKELDSLKLK